MTFCVCLGASNEVAENDGRASNDITELTRNKISDKRNIFDDKNYQEADIISMLAAEEVDLCEVKSFGSSRKNVSDVWKSFRQIRKLDTEELIQNWYICMRCKNPVNNTYGGGTTIKFIRHQQKCLKSATQPKIVQYLNERIPTKIKDDDKDMIRDAAIQFVVDDLRPYYALEGRGLFSLLLAAVKLGQLYPTLHEDDLEKIVPGRMSAQRYVDNKVTDVKAMIKSKLHEAFTRSGGFACTSDLWTDPYRQNNYLAITAHITLEHDSGIRHERLVIAFDVVEENEITNEVVNFWEFCLIIRFTCSCFQYAGTKETYFRCPQ